MKDYKLIKNYRQGGNNKVLFCFPYAGGGASAYRDWTKKYDNNYINICPVQLPGREERMTEKAYTDMNKLVKNIADTIEDIIDTKECYFFGHSMGGKIAYETALELSNRGKKVEHLFIAGCEAPHIPIENPIFDLPDDKFQEEIISYDGTPKELCEDKEIFKFFMPLLRADFALVENYRADEKNTLECPISAMYGTNDREAKYEDVALWKGYTNNKFDIKSFDGGHFFIKSEANSVWKKMLSEMKAS